MICALDHVQLAIPAGGEDKARRFWHGRVGLEEIEKPLALQSRGGCWFALGGQELHLGVEDPFAPAKKAHIGIAVTDIDALAERLAPVTWDETLPDRRRFFTNDPFGNRLEFLQLG